MEYKKWTLNPKTTKATALTWSDVIDVRVTAAASEDEQYHHRHTRSHVCCSSETVWKPLSHGSFFFFFSKICKISRNLCFLVTNPKCWQRSSAAQELGRRWTFYLTDPCTFGVLRWDSQISHL